MNEILLKQMLSRAKLTLRITTDVFDPEIEDLIKAGYDDLATRGVIITEDSDGNLPPLVIRAIMTYVRLHFGNPEDPERLHASYWEQKATLMTTTGYTKWSDDDGSQ